MREEKSLQKQRKAKRLWLLPGCSQLDVSEAVGSENQAQVRSLPSLGGDSSEAVCLSLLNYNRNLSVSFHRRVVGPT